MPRMIAIMPVNTLQTTRVAWLNCRPSQTQKVIARAAKRIRTGTNWQRKPRPELNDKPYMKNSKGVVNVSGTALALSLIHI